MEQTKLNFINLSQVDDHHHIVVYQLNEAQTSHNETPIAWRLIKNSAPDEIDVVSFHPVVEVLVVDSAGNWGEAIRAEGGRLFEIVPGEQQAILQLSDKTSDRPDEFEVINVSADQISSVHCLRNGQLLARTSPLAPGEKVQFRFSNTILIGVLPEVTEGEQMDPALIREMADFDLTLVSGADVRLIGGEEGVSSLTLKVENIERKSAEQVDAFGWSASPNETGENHESVMEGDMFAPPPWWNEIEEKKKQANSAEETFSPTEYWKEVEQQKKTGTSSGSNDWKSPETDMFAPPSWWKGGDSRKDSAPSPEWGGESMEEIPDMFDPPPWWNELEAKKNKETSNESNYVEPDDVFDPPPWWNELEAQKANHVDQESQDTESEDVFDPPPWWNEMEKQKNTENLVEEEYSELDDMFAPPPWWNELEAQKKASDSSEEENDSEQDESNNDQ